MIFLRQKNVYMLLCVLESAFLLVAQIFANDFLLIAALAGFAVLALTAALRDMAIPVLIFFMPWAPLIKMQPGQTSVYTVALLAVLLIYILRAGKNVNVFHLIPAILLFTLTLVVKIFNDFPIDIDYITFFLFLMLFPLLSREVDKSYDFYSLTVFFSLGIIIAALSAQQLIIFPTISRYITVHSYQDITRLAGYYGDPNFYSAHITAALSGIMALVTREAKKSRRAILYLLMIVLLYCGFLSVAKSFVLVTGTMFVFWILQILFERGRITTKLLLLLVIAIGLLFVLSTTLFSDLIDMVIERFVTSGTTISGLTTKRTDLWMSYFDALASDPKLLVFGKGFTDILVNDRASHNTIIQAVYQFGLVGFVAIAAWGVCYFRTVLNASKIRFSSMMPVVILATGTLGTWIALDMLFFYEFFLMPFYLSVGMIFVDQADEERQKEMLHQSE